ncbi:phospholipase a2-alpha [Nicotiana attenuata]|uniref:phospholipase A2 n=1 Tax=Nicotiana attenuata TaxID=49451 RepID=A0A1J6KU63_NICAT|nr:phospholipase a2-alpha [Nicotiana attenuata]
MAFLQSLKLFCLQLLAFCIIALRFPPISVHALNIGIETNAGISLEKECSRTCESKFCAVPPLLRYGKYCGVLYSGCPGEQPCDGLDACCMKHDLCIQRKGNNYLNLECNQSFLNCVATFTKSGAPSFKGNTCSVGILNQTQLKTVDFVHGEPTLVFDMEERQQFAREEGLHQAIVVEVSARAPELKEIRTLLPKQLGVKGHCLIGLLAPRQGHDENTCRYISKKTHNHAEIEEVEVLQEQADRSTVERYQGDLRQLLNAKKMQQVIEDQVLSAEANPTTAAGTQSMGVTEVGKEHAKPGMTKSPTDSEAVSKATVVALAVTAAPVAKPSAADQAESTDAPGALTPTDSLTTKADLAIPKAGLSMAKGAGQTRKSVTNPSNSASKSNDWTVVNRTAIKKKSTDVKEAGNMKQQIGDEERLITGLLLSPGKSGHVTAKDPVVVGGTTGPVTGQKAKEVGHQNLKGQVQQQVTSPNVFEILAAEDDVGINSPPINNAKLVQQYTSDGKKEIGSESKQLLLSTGNVYDVVKEFEKEKSNVKSRQHKQSQDHRELVDRGMLQGKLWANQVGGEEDEDGVDFEYSDDTESEGGSPLSVASPMAQRNKATRTSPTTKLSPITPVLVPSSKAVISAHDRAVLDALDSPKPQKVAHSVGSKSNAQLMQFSGCNTILGEQQAIQPAQGVSGQQQLSHT